MGTFQDFFVFPKIFPFSSQNGIFSHFEEKKWEHFGIFPPDFSQCCET